jgi:DNA-binding transcriptional LysR family regulator
MFEWNDLKYFLAVARHGSTLPTAIADGEPELIRVLGSIRELARSWRLLTHPDLRRTPRIATFFDFIANERDALKSILTG